jgi:small conductance mechanosensitive channel
VVIAELEQLWHQWGLALLAAIPRVAQALVVAVLALYLAGRLQRTVERLIDEGPRRRELARLLGRLVRIVVLCGGVLIILSVFNQTQLVASFIASLGIVGLLVAFALQDITKNFAAGVLLLLQRPFGLDDRIRVEPFEGTVTDITLRATVLRTTEGHEVMIPNAQVFSGPITNLTRYPLRRHTVPLTLSLTVDGVMVQQRVEAAMRRVRGVELEPPPIVAATAVTKDDQLFEARFWVRSAAPTTPAIISAVTGAIQQEVQVLRQEGAAVT